MTVKIYTYGTLRPFRESGHVTIKGTLYHLGGFPGLVMEGDTDVVCEPIEVDEHELKRIDEYEGYDENNPHASLYLRVPVLDGFIYIFNRPVFARPVIESGDWADVAQKQRIVGRVFP